MHTRAALLLIEFQNEWLHPEGKLRPLITGDLLQDAAGHAQEALAAARAAGMPVIHAGLRFSEGYPELGVARHGLRAGIRKLGTFPAAGLGSGIPAIHHVGDRVTVAGFRSVIRGGVKP